MQKNHSLRLCSQLALSPRPPGSAFAPVRLRPSALSPSPSALGPPPIPWIGFGGTQATGIRLSHPDDLPNSATATPAGASRKPLAVPVPVPQHQCEGGRNRLLFAPFHSAWLQLPRVEAAQNGGGSCNSSRTVRLWICYATYRQLYCVLASIFFLYSAYPAANFWLRHCYVPSTSYERITFWKVFRYFIIYGKKLPSLSGFLEQWTKLQLRGWLMFSSYPAPVIWIIYSSFSAE